MISWIIISAKIVFIEVSDTWLGFRTQIEMEEKNEESWEAKCFMGWSYFSGPSITVSERYIIWGFTWPPETRI